MVARYSGISGLIGLFYASAEEPARWRPALLSCLDFLAGIEVILFTPQLSQSEGGLWLFEARPEPQASWTPSVPTKGVEGHLGVSLDLGQSLATRALILQEECGKLFAETARTNISAFQVLRDDSGKLVSCRYFVRNGLDEQQTLFALRRGSTSPSFTDREILLAKLVLPHIGKAVGLHFRFAALNKHQQLAYIGWTDLPGAQGLVGFDGTLIIFNKSMASLLDKAEGLLLQNGNQISCRNASGAKLVQAALKELANPKEATPHPKVIRIQIPSGKPDQLLVMKRIWNEAPTHLRGIQIKVLDLAEQTSVPCAVFKEIFRLTNAECRLLEALMSGLSPNDASAQFNVSANTIRSQLKSIYLKTGVHRQVELFQLALRLNI